VPLLAHARRMYSALSPAYAEDRCSTWMGHRPSLPDSLPILAYRGKPAMLSMPSGTATLACAAQTGTTVAEIVAGEMTQIDVAAFSPRRFD
jgi:D-amino-acid dehydrogenase